MFQQQVSPQLQATTQKIIQQGLISLWALPAPERSYTRNPKISEDLLSELQVIPK